MSDAPWDEKQYLSEHDVQLHAEERPEHHDVLYSCTIDGHLVQNFTQGSDAIIGYFMAGLNLGYRLGRYDAEQSN